MISRKIKDFLIDLFFEYAISNFTKLDETIAEFTFSIMIVIGGILFFIRIFRSVVSFNNLILSFLFNGFFISLSVFLKICVFLFALFFYIFNDGLFYSLLWDKNQFFGFDSNQRQVNFEILVLTKNLHWDFGDIKKINFEGQEYPLKIFVSGFEETFNAMKAIICVGTASIEGEESIEKNRAELRADHIAETIKPLLKKEIDIYHLNLGQFINNSKTYLGDGTDTADQRRVIIIGVIKAEKTANLKKALYNALENNKPLLPFKLSDYSRFKLN